MLSPLVALADATRWRIVELLAERPRSVGIIAELTGLRQPQATKHLQTLERAGIATSRRSGQRRIYALHPETLRALIAELERVADVARGSRSVFDQYAIAVEAETSSAAHYGWADGREYIFQRRLAASRGIVWSHLTDPALLTEWWTTGDLRLAHVQLGTRPGDRVVQEYVDADDQTGAGDPVGRAEGVVDDVRLRERISFRLSPLLPDGSTGFTAHYTWTLKDAGENTDLEVRLRLSESSVRSAEFVAGIELGWEQCLDKLVAIVAANTTRKE